VPNSENVDINRLLAILSDATEKIEAIENAKKEPLAVVGIACNFPGSNTPEDFWSLLKNGEDAVTEIPSDRWDTQEYFDADPSTKGKMYSKAGGFIDTIELFDNEFFSISPREALNMDPQQRRLLELSWEALERAAIDPQTLRGSKTGVYVGVTTNDYGEQIIRSHGLKDLDSFFLSGNTANAIAGRISYFFGFQGPSLTVDTACSSSLTGIHLACQSLRSGESDVALAAGTNFILAPDASVATCSTKMLSPSGRCRTFSDDADGYVRSEGCGVVVLKRLSDAEKDGNPILAVVRGSAINQDGSSAGLTVPNGPAQEKLIRQALENAGMQPSDIGYLEAHGTGTPLGDPIEIRSAAAVYCQDRAVDKPLLLGSVKTNIGHLEACAGMAGFIKSVLCIHNRAIPPHLHFTKPNKAIPWKDYSISVPQQLDAWPDEDTQRAVAVSSFGASGSNAHIILSARLEANSTKNPVEIAAETHEVWRCLPISAKTEAALAKLVSRYIQFLECTVESPFAICMSAATGRKHFEYRVAVVGRSNAELAKALQELAHDDLTQKLIDTDNDALTIANRYLCGESINWLSIQGYAEQAKAILPVYPFKKSPFWLPLRDFNLSKGNPQNEAGVNQTGIALYEPYWKIQSRPLNSGSVLSIDLLKLIADVTPEINDWQQRDSMADYLAGITGLEQASVSLINNAFLQLGISFSTGSQSFDALCKQAGIVGSKRQYFKCLLSILCDAAVLIEEIDTKKSGENKAWRSTALWADSPSLIENLAGNKIIECEWGLLSKCAEQLASVLSGTCDAVELLFPNGEFTAVAPLYKDAYGAVAINHIVAKSVLAIRRQLPKDQTLRILEIGAGTGGTTAQILPCLKKAGMWGNVEYTFTDVSRYFLEKAKEQFSDYEGMTYRILDLETNSLDQGFESSSYDLVLGINVVHATKDIEQVLRNVEQLLVPGGLCLLQEAFSKIRFIDVIFGMTDGWWAFTDHKLRPEHALLNSQQWQNTFEEAGFSSASITTPLDEEAGLFAMQGIVVAEKSTMPTSQRPRSWWIVGGENELQEKFTALIKQKGDQVHTFVEGDPLPLAAESNEKVNVLWCDALGQETGYPFWIGAFLNFIKMITESQLPATLWLLSNDVNLVHKKVRAKTAAVDYASSETHSLAANKPINPGQGTLWGIGKTVALEYPEIWGGLIDLDGSENLASDSQLSKLLDDIQSNYKEDFVAYRNLDRYVQRLSKVIDIIDKPICFSSKASYLITGGSGGIAIELAKWLIAHNAQHVILVGRGALTARTDSQIHGLNESGGSVSYHQIDVCDKPALKLLLMSCGDDATTKAFPVLDSIFHLAGALDDGVLQQQTPQRFDTVLQPKLTGSSNLHELSIELNLCLSHFVLFSSTASLLGSAGQSNHAAANAFMDGLAAMRKQMGLPGLSINWGAWGEIGAVVNHQVGARINSKGMALMSPSQALDHMGFAMLQGAAQLGIFDVDWQHFENRYAFRLFEELIIEGESTQDTATAESDIKRRLMLALDTNKERLLIDYVAGRIAKILGQENHALINMKNGFFELGMDSLTSMELKNILQRDLACELPSTLTFDFPTPLELAKYLAKIFSQTDSGDQHVVDQEGSFYQGNSSEGVEEMIDEDLLDGLSEEEFDSLIDDDLDKLEEAESNYE
jgi:acyl transferase domain-containing protein/SAM-dependent methyltransferase/acyl carrier protein